MVNVLPLFSRAVSHGLALAALVAVPFQGTAGSAQAGAQLPTGSAPAKCDEPQLKQSQGKYGVLVNDPKAFHGYTLLAPIHSKDTYLLDMQGRVVRTWKSDYYPALIAYLLENGHLLRAGRMRPDAFGTRQERGGHVQEYTWGGELVWDFKLQNDKQHRHHDICKLPNGNVLLIVSEAKTARESAAAGRKKPERLHVDCLLEVEPTGKTTGKVVWEWHIWDHLVQDHDKTKANYGDVAAHPERIDINCGDEGFLEALTKNKDELAKLRALGYVGSAPAGKDPNRRVVDWTHTNSVAYNAELDQIMLSVRHHSEIWIIDHGTTRVEAASHSGGRRGKGGDLLYRWGNPRTYRAGTAKDQQLFFQHDAHWITRGLPGEGHVLIFNNGPRRLGDDYSSVDEIVLPLDKEGRYVHMPRAAYRPDRPLWTYAAPSKRDFYSSGMAGAQRLPNGNTLICSTTTGTILEVTAANEVVWKHVLAPPRSAGATHFQKEARLVLAPAQLKKLMQLQLEIFARLATCLTDAQKEQLKDAQETMGSFTLIGLFMPPSFPGKLHLTATQKERVAALEKEALGKLDELLKIEQRDQLHKMLKNLPRRLAQAADGCFRAYRYAPDYPGLVGRELTPGKTLEGLQPRDAPSRELR
jgi:hypothetical protein